MINARGFVVLLFAAVVLYLAAGSSRARDDGRYAQSPLKSWFDHLASGKGLCCSFADGVSVEDPDWTADGDHFRVKLEGVWVDVPEDAVITEPNKLGKTMVWPTSDGKIRCFMPGPMG